MLVTMGGVMVRGRESQAREADWVKVWSVLAVRVGQKERADQAAHRDQWDQNCSQSLPGDDAAEGLREREGSGCAAGAAHRAQCSVGLAERLRGDSLDRT